VQQPEIRHTAGAAIRSGSVSSDTSDQKIGTRPEDETLATAFRSQEVTGTADVWRLRRSARERLPAENAHGSQPDCLLRTAALRFVR